MAQPVFIGWESWTDAVIVHFLTNPWLAVMFPLFLVVPYHSHDTYTLVPWDFMEINLSYFSSL